MIKEGEGFDLASVEHIHESEKNIFSAGLRRANVGAPSSLVKALGILKVLDPCVLVSDQIIRFLAYGESLTFN